MGLFPPEAGEDAMPDQGRQHSKLNRRKISPDEKQDDLFPVSGTESEPTIKVSIAAINQSTMAAHNKSPN